MINAILRYPTAYIAQQSFCGARNVRRRCIADYLGSVEGKKVCDFGCGPGLIAPYLKGSLYTGIDIDQAYVRYAKKHFGEYGEFHCAEVTESTYEQFGTFDVILLNGILHHVDDEYAKSMLGLCLRMLNTGGCVMTLDGYRHPRMSRISRVLMDLDRGNFIRSRENYLQIANEVFPSVSAFTRNDMGILPYDFIIMICRESERPSDFVQN